MSGILLRAIYLSLVFTSGILIGEMYTPEIIEIASSITSDSDSVQDKSLNQNLHEDAKKKPRQRKIYRTKV
jgi:hypothetical protein